MTDINLKTLSPDTSLPTTGFLFGADSQASTNPSVYSTQTVATTLLGSTVLTGGPALTADAPVLNLAQTWDNVAVTFTGIKYNATNTNSSAGSMMMDLQVGGTSYFNVARNGTITLQTTLNLMNGANTPIQLNAAQKALACTLDFVIKWQSSTSSLSGVDYAFFGVRTTSTAANPIFRFGAADAASPVAQTLSVQSIVAGQTNASAAAYPFTITGSQGTGSGAGGSIVFKVAPAGGSGTAQNALVDALTIAPVGTGSFLTVPQCATNIVAIGITSGNGISIRSGGVIDIISGGGGIATFTNAIATGSQFNVGICFSNGSTTAAGPDVFVLRDAVNTLAQRNGTAAQALNIYNTYTSSTSFERYSVDWITTANLAIVGPNKGSGGGTQRVQRLSYLEDGGAGSTVPLLGSTCPAASGTVKSWIKIITSDGTTAYIPCWA
jgi:hypothetical protein